MKVLFVSSGNSPRGIGPIVKNQGESLKAAGVEVDYFPIKGKGIKGYLRSIFSLRKFLKTGSYDIVHAHYSFSGFVAALAGARPLTVSLMGSDVYTGLPGRSLIKFFSRRRWKRVIVKSRGLRDKIKIPVHVLPNGVDFSRFRVLDRGGARREVSFNPAKKHIIFAADPRRQEKNFALAQQAFDLLARQDVELHSVFDEDISRIPYFMNAADVLLLTSLWEGSPNVVKEAMACNCPIVSTDVGDVKEVTGKTEGCYITSFDAADASAKLRSALAFGRRTEGRKAIGHLDSAVISRKLIGIYEEMLDGRNP